MSTTLGAIAVLMIGVFGFGGTGFCCSAIALIRSTNATVLAAAPCNEIRVTPLKWAFVKLYDPPPYISATFSNVQLSQSSPSSACVVVPFGAPLNDPLHILGPNVTAAFGCTPSMTIAWLPPEKSKLVNMQDRCAGGACGAGAGVGGVCAKIDVWLPKIAAQQAPTINDPNASVILDITPPPSGKSGNCTVWVYHYGEPPPVKKPDRRGTVHQKTKPKIHAFSTSIHSRSTLTEEIHCYRIAAS